MSTSALKARCYDPRYTHPSGGDVELLACSTLISFGKGLDPSLNFKPMLTCYKAAFPLQTIETSFNLIRSQSSSAARNMASPYSQIPVKATKQPAPFQISISEEKLSDFEALLKLSKITAPTYESLQEDRRFGVGHKWITDAKKYWEEDFDW
jgi:hypothetical protein